MVTSDIAGLSHQLAVAKLKLYAQARDVDVREGRGWWALRTRAESNDLNGVVSEPHAVLSASVVAELVDWFRPTPASWLSWPQDPTLTSLLLEAGARPERTGIWSGALIATLNTQADDSVVRVRTERQLDLWLGLAASAGWIETEEDLAVRRSLALSLGLDHPALRHWLAFAGQQPVGFATSFVDGEVVELTALGVVESYRRRGTGRVLVSARLADAVSAGAKTVVSSPSPDGWALQRTLGFSQVPVRPDTCFYLT